MMFKVVFLARRRTGADAADRPLSPFFEDLHEVAATECVCGPLLAFARTFDERGRRDLFELFNAEIVLTRHDHVVSTRDAEVGSWRIAFFGWPTHSIACVAGACSGFKAMIVL